MSGLERKGKERGRCEEGEWIREEGKREREVGGGGGVN